MQIENNRGHTKALCFQKPLHHQAVAPRLSSDGIEIGKMSDIFPKNRGYLKKLASLIGKMSDIWRERTATHA